MKRCVHCSSWFSSKNDRLCPDCKPIKLPLQSDSSINVKIDEMILERSFITEQENERRNS